MSFRADFNKAWHSEEMKEIIANMEEYMPGFGDFVDEYFDAMGSLADVVDDLESRKMGGMDVYALLSDSDYEETVTNFVKFLIMHSQIINTMTAMRLDIDYSSMYESMAWYISAAVQSSFWYGYRAASSHSNTLPDWE